MEKSLISFPLETFFFIHSFFFFFSQMSQKSPSKSGPKTSSVKGTSAGKKKSGRDESVSVTFVGSGYGTATKKRIIRRELKRMDEKSANRDALSGSCDSGFDLGDSSDEDEQFLSQKKPENESAQSTKKKSHDEQDETMNDDDKDNNDSDSESSDDSEKESHSPPFRVSVFSYSSPYSLRKKNRDDFDTYITKTKRITRGRNALAHKVKLDFLDDDIENDSNPVEPKKEGLKQEKTAELKRQTQETVNEAERFISASQHKQEDGQIPKGDDEMDYSSEEEINMEKIVEDDVFGSSDED